MPAETTLIEMVYAGGVLPHRDGVFGHRTSVCWSSPKVRCLVKLISINFWWSCGTLFVLSVSDSDDIDVAVVVCQYTSKREHKLECGSVPNVMVALPNTGGTLCSTLQSLADAHY